MPEDTIGICILQRQIGKGGMGAVFLAHDPTLDRPVAVRRTPKLVHLARAPGAAATLPTMPVRAGSRTTSVPPQAAASKGRFRLHLALGRQPVTGHLVSIDPKKDAVPIQREDGTIERIAYRSVLRIETLGGR